MTFLLCLVSKKQEKTDWYNKFWEKETVPGLNVIKKLQKEPKISSTFEIDGKIYKVQGIRFSTVGDPHLVRVIEVGYKKKQKFNVKIHDTITCPVCGLIHEMECSKKVSMDSVEKEYKTCENCDSEFEYECSVKVDIKVTTKKKINE